MQQTIGKTLMLGTGLFWLAAGPVGMMGGEPALIVLALGVLISGSCTLSAHALARWGVDYSRKHNKSEMWAASIGAPVRLLTVAGGLLAIWWLTDVSMVQLLVVVALTYPMFLIPSALWLASELNERQEARIA